MQSTSEVMQDPAPCFILGAGDKHNTSHFLCTAVFFSPPSESPGQQSVYSTKCQPLGWVAVVLHRSTTNNRRTGIRLCENSTYLRAPCCSCTWHWTLASNWYYQPRLSPPVALAVSACTCRWQMWWWRRAGKRPATSTSALMTAGPPTNVMPRAACRRTPKDSRGASRNWPTMWVVGIKEVLRLWMWMYYFWVFILVSSLYE